MSVKIENVLLYLEPKAYTQEQFQIISNILSNNKIKATVLSVVESNSSIASFFSPKEKIIIDKALLEQRKLIIDSLVENHLKDVVSETLIVQGKQFYESIKLIHSRNIDMFLKFAEDPSWTNRIFGSNDMHLLRKCPCPLLILKPNANTDLVRILASIDLNNESFNDDEARIKSKLNQRIIEFAEKLCHSNKQELHLSSIVEVFAEEFLSHGGVSSLSEDKVDAYIKKSMEDNHFKMNNIINKLRENSKEKELNIRSHLIKGKAVQEIPKLLDKHNIDLVVMGTVARTGIPGYLIGNTAEEILEQINCSVLAIKPDGFKSPITK